MRGIALITAAVRLGTRNGICRSTPQQVIMKRLRTRMWHGLFRQAEQGGVSQRLLGARQLMWLRRTWLAQLKPGQKRSGTDVEIASSSTTSVLQ